MSLAERTLPQLEGDRRSPALPEAGRMKSTPGFGTRNSVVFKFLNHSFSFQLIMCHFFLPFSLLPSLFLSPPFLPLSLQCWELSLGPPICYISAVTELHPHPQARPLLVRSRQFYLHETKTITANKM